VSGRWRPMLKLVAIGASLLGLWFLSAFAHELGKTALAATKAAIDDAQHCDEEAAQRRAQLPSETADAVALAAFDSCHNLWDAEQSKYSDVVKSMMPTPREIKENPFALSTYIQFVTGDNSHSIEAWKRSEVDRLRPMIMETRLKSLTPVPGK
jgi:hypothetical protein